MPASDLLGLAAANRDGISPESKIQNQQKYLLDDLFGRRT